MAQPPERTVPDLTGYLTHAGHVLETQLSAALAEIGDMDKTTMVVTVDALEKAGLAERRPSATDRRARIIAVTDAGARIAAEGQRIVDRVHADALAALAASQRQPFVDAMTTLVDGPLATPVSAQPVRRSRQRAG